MYLDRYKKNQPEISIDEQHKLSKLKVVVVGCGGLGGYIIEHLTRLGIGEITVVDGDVFVDTNLNRQILSTTENLGKPKVYSAKDRIKKVSPNTKVNYIFKYIDESNALEILNGHDYILDALDNVETRFILEKYAGQLNIPLVHGGISGWCGRVCTIMPGDRLLNDLYFKYDEQSNIISGNLSFTASFTASLQVCELLKLILNKTEFKSRTLIQFDLLNWNIEQIQL